MLLGVIAPQLKPLGMVSVRVTTPVNPLSAVIVIVELGDWPTLAGAGDVAEIWKSGPDGTATATVAEWEREPLTPVTVTL